MSILQNRLSSITDDLLTLVSDRVYAEGWQNAGGVMPFADAMGVLRNLLAEMNSAESDGLSDGMPRALLQTISGRLDNIVSHLQNLTGGSNSVAAFTDDVDRLHLDVWQGGFRYRGKTVVGYEAKYQQLSRIAVEAEKIKELRSEANRSVEAIKSEVDRVAQATSTLLEREGAANLSADAIQGILASAQQSNSSLLAQIQEIDAKARQAAERASDAEAHAQSAGTHEKRIQQFVDRVDTREKKLDETISRTDDSVRLIEESIKEFQEAKAEEVDDFIERLTDIEKNINDKLAKATGVTLFYSFNERQKAIKEWIWLLIAGALLLVGSIATYSLLYGLTKMDVALAIKLAFSLPVLIAVWFSLGQYGKERRLKEEYAFKSTISLSFEAYRKLAEEAMEKLPESERTKFAEFFISSISSIFDSPTERVFGHRRTPGRTDTRLLSSAAKDVTELVKTVKS